MAPDDKIRDDLAALEDTLRDLVPALPRMSAGQTMYLAGQQAARREQRRQRFWPACAACLAIACITMGVLLVRQGEPQIVYVPAPSHEAQPDATNSEDTTPAKSGNDRGRWKTPAEARHERAIAETDWSAAPAGQVWKQLDQWLDESALDAADSRELPPAGPAESTLVATVHSGDWPALLPGQTAGERFRALASPLRQNSGSAIQNLTALFSTRGL